MATRATWLAPALVLATSIGACSLYDTTGPPLADAALLVYAICLVLTPALLFAWLRARGASLAAAAVAAPCVAVAWVAKEFWELSAVFSAGETLYYFFNPVSLGLFATCAFQMASAELVARRRAGRPLRGPALVLAGILALGGATALAARGSGGRELFYAYVSLHARLFGG